MRKNGSLFLAGALILSAPLPALAGDQGHAHSCPADGEAVLPDALSGWNERIPFGAVGNEAELAAASLTPGQAVDAALLRTPDVSYVVRPEKPGGSVSYGGLFSFTVEEAGTFRVALGSGAWIDMLQGKAVIESVAHGHGPQCSGIRKMVDFPLEQGSYTLQVAANGKPDLPLLVTRLP